MAKNERSAAVRIEVSSLDEVTWPPHASRATAAALPRGWVLADRLTRALAMGAPALLTLYLSFNDGGYFPLPPALGAAGLALVLALRILCARRMSAPSSAGLFVFLGALGLLAAWTLMSESWSHSTGRALIAYDRTLMYALAAAVAASVSYTPARLRLAVYAMLGSMVAVCVGAFVAGTIPELWHAPRALYSSRLSYPLNYPNALGILATVATVLAFHVTCTASGPRAARVFAAAATPLTAVTLYMTLSRGAAWSAVLALVVYVALGRPRALVRGLLAVAPATAVALVATYLIGFHAPVPSGSLVPGGHLIAAVVAVAMVTAGLLRRREFDRTVPRLKVKLPRMGGRRGIAVIGLLALLMLAGAGAYIDQSAHESASPTPAPTVGQGPGRLTSVNPDGRIAFWKVALNDFRAQPVHGLGAGMYAVSWAASSAGDTTHHDAQSLYLQTLAELGMVGLTLLLAALGTLAVGLVRRARVNERAAFVALLAAGLAWSTSAAVDWDWEMPAVTLWLFALGGIALSGSIAPGRARRRAFNAARWPVRAAGALACLGLAVTPAAMALSEYRLHQSIGEVIASCPRASADATSSLAAIGSRAEPYQILGFCDLGAGRPQAALQEMQHGLSHDPQNWQLHYGAAVALAGSGQDPRPEIRVAETLAPTERLVIDEAAAMFSAEPTSASWRTLAAVAWLPLPLVPLAPDNGPQFGVGTFVPLGQAPPPL